MCVCARRAVRFRNFWARFVKAGGLPADLVFPEAAAAIIPFVGRATAEIAKLANVNYEVHAVNFNSVVSDEAVKMRHPPKRCRG